MATIFNLKDDELNEKINMDELYEKQQQDNLETLKLYQKILSRIHVRIKSVSRQRNNPQFCTYLIPEVMIGIPRYNHSECTAFIISKLKENGFNIKYTHPNLLFISWKHWIPGYVRNEVKKQTGFVIDGYGNVNDKSETHSNKNIHSDNNTLLLSNTKDIKPKKEKEFKSIKTYVPSGNIIYNEDLFKKINDKTSNK